MDRIIFLLFFVGANFYLGRIHAASTQKTGVAPVKAPENSLKVKSKMDQKEQKFDVQFQLSRQVGNEVPELTVKVKNNSKQAIPFMKMSSPVCFCWYYLEMKLSTVPSVAENLTQMPCIPKAWPGVYGDLEPGQQSVWKFKLSEIFSMKPSWPKGRYQLDLDWKPNFNGNFDGQYDIQARQTSRNFSVFLIQEPLKTFEIKRGESVQLPDGAMIEFKGHSHKDTTSADQESPLMINGKFTVSGDKSGESFYVSVFPKSQRQFKIADDYFFTLLSEKYDESMRLQYYGKIETLD